MESCEVTAKGVGIDLLSGIKNLGLNRGINGLRHTVCVLDEIKKTKEKRTLLQHSTLI